MSFFNGDGPATPPPAPACGGAPSSPALTAAGAGAAAASNPELDHPKSLDEDKHSNSASGGGGSSSQSATAQLMARLKSKAKRQPLVAALACCVAVLLCYVGMMETLHNASTRRIRSKTAAIEVSEEIFRFAPSFVLIQQVIQLVEFVRRFSFIFHLHFFFKLYVNCL
jgi:hypothetical protein